MKGRLPEEESLLHLLLRGKETFGALVELLLRE